MLPPDQALLAPLLPSSCSMQPSFTMFVHGPTTTCSRSMASAYAASTCDACKPWSTLTVVCMSLVFLTVAGARRGVEKVHTLRVVLSRNLRITVVKLPLSSGLPSAACEHEGMQLHCMVLMVPGDVCMLVVIISWQVWL